MAPSPTPNAFGGPRADPVLVLSVMGSIEGGLTPEKVHEARTRLLAQALAREGPRPGPPFPCPYLPGRLARNLTLVLFPASPGSYHSLMDLNFRRLGPVFYRPQCDRCAECRMIRVRVGEFRPSRAQRRCWARNRDLSIEITAPATSAEKLDLYRRYLAARHNGQMEGSAEEFEGFLCASRVRTVEIDYRAEGRLLAVGIADLEPLAMSAVYCFFEPEAASRSLGVFNVLWMIEECRRRGLPHLYLGYYVRDSRKMSYKALYRPRELLAPDGRWLPVVS